MWGAPRHREWFSGGLNRETGKSIIEFAELRIQLILNHIQAISGYVMKPFSIYPLLLVLASLFIVPLSGCDAGSVSDDATARAPAPVEPAQGAQTATAVLLSWTPVDDVVRYRYQVAGDEGFTELILEDISISFPRAPVRELLVNETYFWRVRAEFESTVSDWSTPRQFDVRTLAQVPDPPRLKLPAYDEKDLERSVHIEWEPVEGAYSYHLVVTIDEDMFLYQADLENIEEAFFDIDDLIFTYPYWWKVRALGPAGYSEWSPVWIFWVTDGI